MALEHAHETLAQAVLSLAAGAESLQERLIHALGYAFDADAEEPLPPPLDRLLDEIRTKSGETASNFSTRVRAMDAEEAGELARLLVTLQWKVLEHYSASQQQAVPQ